MLKAVNMIQLWYRSYQFRKRLAANVTDQEPILARTIYQQKSYFKIVVYQHDLANLRFMVVKLPEGHYQDLVIEFQTQPDKFTTRLELIE